jgi:tyrosyl-tRNA synthetase
VIDVNKMIRAGCRVKILIEDKRMGGDLSKIRTTGRHMIEVWKALGMDLDGVEFLWSSEEISKRAHLYWPMVMGLARETKVVRLARYMFGHLHHMYSLLSLLIDSDQISGMCDSCDIYL